MAEALGSVKWWSGGLMGLTLGITYVLGGILGELWRGGASPTGLAFTLVLGTPFVALAGAVLGAVVGGAFRFAARRSAFARSGSARGVYRIVLFAGVLGALSGMGAAALVDTGPQGARIEQRVVLDSGDVQIVGTSESIAAVADMEVLPDGSVWVLNSLEPLFVQLAPDGSVLAAHGRLGDGPDELNSASGLVQGGVRGGVWVLDTWRSELAPVSDPDGELEPIRLDRDLVPPGRIAPGMNLLGNVVRTARMGFEVVLPLQSTPPEGGVFGHWLSVWTADLLALDPGTGEVSPFLRLGEVLGDPTPHFELDGTALPFPLWYRLWAVCGPDRHLRLFDQLRNELRGFTRQGTELTPLPLPPPTVLAVDPADFAQGMIDVAIVESMGEFTGRVPQVSPEDSVRFRNQLLQRVTATPEELAAVLPRYVDYRCDEEGAHWLRPFDLEEGGLSGSPVWLRMGPYGGVTEVRFPERFDPHRFTPDRIWGVQRNELDVPSIAWIPTPGSSP